MSERSLLSLLLASAALVAPLQAQDLAQLKRREAELTARRDELRAQQAAEAEGRFQSEQRRVLPVGRLHVAYPEWAAEGNDGRLTAALQGELRRYGSAIDSFPMDTLFVWVDGVESAADATSATVRFRMGGVSGMQVVAIADDARGSWVGDIVTAAIQRWGMDLLDRPLARWLGGLDPRSTVASLRDPIVRELVASPSSRARRCLNGTTDDCRLLLELGDGGHPLLEAYDAADLPPLFVRMDMNTRIPGRANCVGRRDPAACAELVRLGRAAPPHPVSGRARQSLFAYAIASGGEGAWVRLHRAQGRPVAEQLGLAAGRPVDSLLVSWQHDLRAGRRTTTAGLAPSLMLALGWSLVGIILFAWRYRWRHV